MLIFLSLCVYVYLPVCSALSACMYVCISFSLCLFVCLSVSLHILYQCDQMLNSKET